MTQPSESIWRAIRPPNHQTQWQRERMHGPLLPMAPVRKPSFFERIFR